MRQLVRKVIVAAAVVVALALPAFATDAPQFYDGKITINAESKNGGKYELNRSIQLKLRYDNLNKESGEASWRLDAELGSLLNWNGGDAFKVGKYRLMVTDPRLKVAVWGNGFEYETKELPFGTITSQKAAPNHTARLSYGPVTLDLRLENDWEKTTLFYDQALGNFTVGGAVQHQNDINNPPAHMDIFGAYVKGDFGSRLTDTEIAVYTRTGNHANVTGENAGGQYRVAAKTTVPLVNNFDLELEGYYHLEHWGNDSEVTATFVHDNPTLGEIKLYGSHRFYPAKPDDEESAIRQHVIGLEAERGDYQLQSEYSQEPSFTDLNKREAFVQFRYRTTEAVDFDDLFSDWQENSGMAYGVRLDSIVEDVEANPDEAPTNTITVDVGGRLQPGGRIWVSGKAVVQMDQNGADWEVEDAAGDGQKLGEGDESTMGMSVEGRVRYFADMRNVWVTPWARFGSGKTATANNSLMAAGVDVEYELDKLTYTLAVSAGTTNIDDVQASQSRVLAGAVLEF